MANKPRVPAGNRDAGTGKYVTPGYAKTHPKTTVKETKPAPPSKKKK